MRTINKIIVHCAATIEGKNFTVEDIDRWHKSQGWNEIGYHFVVYLDGSIHKGRDITKVGAHTIGQNKNSIGICYIGGLDKNSKPKDTRTPEQKVALEHLLTTLKCIYPDATIHGHNEYANKACPCFNAQEEYNNI